ncbi:hypothetical protein CTTA_2949 [Comamonas testosteroni]|uniref:Uncharacterized protein n=2 Tax=Comamonas testosteroni TaxID=285 RepID=A0A5A7MGA5_COMTE|nr:hypothetical protein CTTA_2949 [Comamonas testosteroni]
MQNMNHNQGSAAAAATANDAMARAQAEAREHAQQRQLWGARALEEEAMRKGYLLMAVQRTRHAPEQGLLYWPGTVQVLEIASGSLLAELPVADLQRLRPDLMELFIAKARDKPILGSAFTSPHGTRLRASLSVQGVVTVYSQVSKQMLAMSEPWQPGVLRSDFQLFRPEDMRPRIQ